MSDTVYMCPKCGYKEKLSSYGFVGCGFVPGPMNLEMKTISGICSYCFFQKMAESAPKMKLIKGLKVVNEE